jgi:quinolinate synthase
MNKTEKQQLKEEILRKKQEKSIYIIAHYYQRSEVQEIADFVGDSYAMALAARDSESEIILVAGVDFMAETAAILCPDKIILSPEPAATCPMANSISAEHIRTYRELHPDTLVVTYVNTPAEVKAVSDVCVTSSNAEKIISRLPEDKKIYFVPDQNLARNIARGLDREITAYDSACPIHAVVTKDEIIKLKAEHPEALVLVHPECDPEVVQLADYAGSTAGILNKVVKSDEKIFIIGTESGIFHAIQKQCPEKQLILASKELICPNMKSITLSKIKYSIDDLETPITVPGNIARQAAVALEKMIELASEK